MEPWLYKYIRDQQKIVRWRQRAWNTYRQPHHWTAYTKERNIYKWLMVYHRGQAITKKIMHCKKDSKQLFSVNSITNNKPLNPLLERFRWKNSQWFCWIFIEKNIKNQRSVYQCRRISITNQWHTAIKIFTPHNGRSPKNNVTEEQILQTQHLFHRTSQKDAIFLHWNNNTHCQHITNKVIIC